MTQLNALPLSIEAFALPDLDTQPLSGLASIAKQLAQFKKTIRQCDDTLNGALGRRFAEHASQLRRQQNKDTGTVRLAVEGYVVIADLPKKAEYDQDKLHAALETLQRWGENPNDYVTTEIKVPEAKYNAWPPAVRALFEPARTVRTGKPTYKLELAGSDNDAQMHEVA